MNLAYLARSTIPCREANSIHVMKMCQAYARLGHRVTLVVPHPGRRAEPEVNDVHAFYGVERNFRVVRVPLPAWLPESLTFGILLPLVAGLLVRPQMVHSRSLPPAWGSVRLLRRPTLYETHAPPKGHPRQRKFFDGLTKSRRLAAVVVITQALARDLVQALPRPVPLVVAPDGVDETWLDMELSKEEARRRLGLESHGSRLAVYTGHLYPGRGVELILDLAARLPDHRFILVGGSEEDLARHRSAGEQPPNVGFVGFRPPQDIPMYLRAADVLLMPYGSRVAVAGGGDSARYMSPMKMFEYMAAGRPVVASDLPALREILQPEDHALLCPDQEPDAWESSLRRIAAEPGLAERLGRSARQHVRTYTWEHRARRLLDAVERAP